MKDLVQERFEALKRGLPAGSFDAEEQGCVSPAHRSSQSDEPAKREGTASETSTPRAAKPETITIDLTDNPEDDEPVHSLPSQSPGNKRKRHGSASNSNAQSDRDEECDFGSLVKRRRLAGHRPSPNLYKRYSGRVVLILEEVKLKLSDGRKALYSWDKGLGAWTGNPGMYKIGRMPADDLRLVVSGKVRPIGIDALPVYIFPTVGDQGEDVVEGADIDEKTWQVSSGEFRDMLVDPFARRYIGHVI